MAWASAFGLSDFYFFFEQDYCSFFLCVEHLPVASEHPVMKFRGVLRLLLDSRLNLFGKSWHTKKKKKKKQKKKKKNNNNKKKKSCR